MSKELNMVAYDLWVRWEKEEQDEVVKEIISMKSTTKSALVTAWLCYFMGSGVKTELLISRLDRFQKRGTR